MFEASQSRGDGNPLAMEILGRCDGDQNGTNRQVILTGLKNTHSILYQVYCQS